MSDKAREEGIAGVKRMAVFLLLISSPLVSAHHAPSLYDSDSMMAIEGKFIAYEHRNPHTRLTLEIAGEDGETSTWTVSMPSPQGINEKGYTERLKGLEAGTPIRVRGWPHFVNDREIRSYKVYLEGDEMLQMVYNNNFKHKDQIRIEEYLADPEKLGVGSNVAATARERVGQWVEEDDYTRRVAIEFNAGQAAFVGVASAEGTVYPGVEEHLACLPGRTDTISLGEELSTWAQGDRVAGYIQEYNDTLARRLEISRITCGD
jgi:hypothetical protein